MISAWVQMSCAALRMPVCDSESCNGGDPLCGRGLVIPLCAINAVHFFSPNLR